MINETYKAMLQGKSVIRELSEYATARGAEIGYENVFDYSLGNPSVPCTQDYTDAVIRLHQEENPMALHGYSPSLGNTKVRGIVADSTNRTNCLLFKCAVEQGVMAHTIAAHFGDAMEDRRALRGYVTDEVKRTNGQMRFEDAQDLQRQLPDFD